MPVERIHPSRRMLLPRKPPTFCFETSDSLGRCDKERGCSVMTNFSLTPSSLSLLGSIEPRIP